VEREVLNGISKGITIYYGSCFRDVSEQGG
jgi:hypothetical protein